MVFCALWLAAAHTVVQGTGDPEPELTPQAYLPIVARPTWMGNAVVNGGFELGAVGWHQYTNGTGPKDHDLIGSEAEGFTPYEGDYAARLGGYEGTWDVLTQTVSIPEGGHLSYWWQMYTYDPPLFQDHFNVDLLTLGGEHVAYLAGHGVDGPEGIWQQDVVDVSAYAGQTLVLRLDAYNDNYASSWFDIDLVSLCPTW
jgi:hypothetical protein